MFARRSTAVRIGFGVAAGALAAAMAACSNQDSPINRPSPSGSESASTVNGVQQVTLTTGDDYRFHPSTFTVHPGRLQVVLRNTGKGAPHTFQVNGFPATFVPETSAGMTAEATFTVPPVQGGKATTYGFVCTIHVKQGQRGEMIVVP